MRGGEASVFSRFRLAGASVMVGIALVGVAFYTTVNNRFLGAIIARTLGPYSDALAEHGFASSDPEIWRRMALRHDVTILLEPAGAEAVAFDRRGRAVLPESLGEGPIRAVRTGEDGTRVTLFWQLTVFQNSHLPLLSGLLVMVAAVVGSAFWFLHRQLQPLAALERGVDAVGEGNFETRVPPVRDDEIGRVAAAFNVMAGRVGEMIEDRERLLADVSHELRSPIGRMKVALELLPASGKRDALDRDLREMENLVAVLLEREALRSRAVRLATEEVDLKTLAGEVAVAFADRGPGVGLVADAAVTVDADPALIRLLIRNLIDNAIKFSRPDSRPVEVLLESDEDGVVLRVLDDGVGIPAGSEQELFKPFVKADSARGHGVGYGVGLNLCQRIVELHGGTIRLLPRQPRGTEAIVTLRRS